MELGTQTTVAAPPTTGGTVAAPAQPTGGGYTGTSIFADNFDGDQLNPDMWAFGDLEQRPGQPENNGAGYTTADGWTPTNVPGFYGGVPPEVFNVGGGCANFHIIRKRYPGMPADRDWTSATISSRIDLDSGFWIPDGATTFYETRVFIDTGLANWFGAWFQGLGRAEFGWPRCGELDFETVNNGGLDYGRCYMTNHWSRNDLPPGHPDVVHDAAYQFTRPDTTAPADGEAPGVSVIGKWTTLGMKRGPDGWEAWFDGIKRLTSKPGVSYKGQLPAPVSPVYDKALFLRYDWQQGGGWGGALLNKSQWQPGTLKVDYTKVWLL